MSVSQKTIEFSSPGQGLHDLTKLVSRELEMFGISRGVLTLFCRHTSCSLVIMENADPAARADLEAWFNRLVPENDCLFKHTEEGPDDMPSHVKMVLTRTSETIPFSERRLLLGKWQGVYLWEHRRSPHKRTIVITAVGE